MPDITMCINTGCTIRQRCYRYRAIPNEHRQSICEFKQDAKGDCEHFWPVEGQRLAPLKEGD